MAPLTYENELTGLIVIDPYNDFISEGGKVWGRLKGIAEANQCIPHMQQVLGIARAITNLGSALRRFRR
jgi:ureidoacrylate peracid hydrolase